MPKLNDEWVKRLIKKLQKEENETIKRIDKIIQEWEETWLDSGKMVELLVPDLKKIICFFERIQDELKKALEE